MNEMNTKVGEDAFEKGERHYYNERSELNNGREWRLRRPP
jgi:hypothetical protein